MAAAAKKLRALLVTSKPIKTGSLIVYGRIADSKTKSTLSPRSSFHLAERPGLGFTPPMAAATRHRPRQLRTG